MKALPDLRRAQKGDLRQRWVRIDLRLRVRRVRSGIGATTKKRNDPRRALVSAGTMQKIAPRRVRQRDPKGDRSRAHKNDLRRALARGMKKRMNDQPPVLHPDPLVADSEPTESVQRGDLPRALRRALAKQERTKKNAQHRAPRHDPKRAQQHALAKMNNVQHPAPRHDPKQALVKGHSDRHNRAQQRGR